MTQILDRIGSILNYILGFFMVFVGVATAISPLVEPTAALGFFLSHRLVWVGVGAIFVACGGMLLYGKFAKKRIWVQRGLMAIYLCFVFSAIVNGYGEHWQMSAWIGNAVASVIVGGLYLRFRTRTAYIDPKEFEKDIDGLNLDGPPSRQYHFNKDKDKTE